MIIRIIKYAIKNIFRNKFLSISSVLVLTLLMFFINILVVLHDVSFKLIENINSKLTISLYLKDEYPIDSIEVEWIFDDIEKNIQTVDIIYKTKNEVLDDLQKRDEELVRILEWDNPLPNTIEIKNIKINEYEILDDIIKKRLYILSDNNSKENSLSSYIAQYNRIIKIINILNSLQIGLYFIIWVFIFSISIIMYSIISNFIYYYRDEIYITKLVWWSNFFIFGPFSFQWMIYSLLSYSISIIIFIFLIKNINFLFTDYNYTFDIYNPFYYNIFLIEFLVYIFIWLFSWYFSTKKYLK